jgi:hypothetical protein
MCPVYGSWTVTVVFEPPTNRQASSGNRELPMTTMTHYVALGFTRFEEEGGIVACGS